MKILLVITKSELGGAQIFTSNLAKGLKDKGNEVVVAGGEGDYLPEKLLQENIIFYRLTKLKRNYNPISFIKYVLELRRYVKNDKFDIVHFNSTNAMIGVWGFLFLKPKPKTFFTVHGLSFLDNNHKKNKILNILYKMVFSLSFKRINQIIFVSESNYKHALKNNITKKGVVVHNGVNFPHDYFLDKEEAVKFLENSAGIDLSSSFIYGSIGRLAYPKNYDFLIKLYPEVKKINPNAKLILIGDGPERTNYENIIKSLKLEKDVFLLGKEKDASRYLKAFDLFVLPSIFEGLSYSLIEAVYAKVNAIASLVGNEEVIGVENCFKLNNKEEFLNFIKNPNKIKIVYKTFDHESMINSYIKIYEI